MSSSNLIRWCGLAGMLSGALLFLFSISNPARDIGYTPTGVAQNPYVVQYILGAAAAVLGQLGLVGLFAAQKERAGILGLLGFAAAFVALALTATEVFFDAYIIPLLAANAPDLLAGQLSAGPVGLLFQLTSITFVAGFVLFGLATLSAGILPRWGALLLAVGSPYVIGRLPDVVRIAAVAAFGLGLIWLGFALWSGAGKTTK